MVSNFHRVVRVESAKVTIECPFLIDKLKIRNCQVERQFKFMRPKFLVGDLQIDSRFDRRARGFLGWKKTFPSHDITLITNLLTFEILRSDWHYSGGKLLKLMCKITQFGESVKRNGVSFLDLKSGVLTRK